MSVPELLHIVLDMSIEVYAKILPVWPVLCLMFLAEYCMLSKIADIVAELKLLCIEWYKNLKPEMFTGILTTVILHLWINPFEQPYNKMIYKICDLYQVPNATCASYLLPT